ncbi:MAG: IS607 family transposase [Acidobacteria bacterium]|nr:IS607 family transposase [Acidobacteriota bacterium]
MGDWARSQGLQPREAWQRMRRGTLPSSLRPVRMGRFWFVEVDEVLPRLKRVAYARVSSSDQKADLARQKLRLLEHAQREGWLLDAVIEEVGSALNGTRRKLLKVLANPSLGWFVVEHRDRLARFGFEMVEAVLRARGGGVVVID